MKIDCETLPIFLTSALLLLRVCRSSEMSAPSEASCSGAALSRTRPAYIRSNLARSVYRKMMEDEEFNKFDKRQWYRVDAASLDEATASRFVQLAADDDADTLAFLDGCQEQSNAVFTQMWHLLARTFLSFFVTQTSINGFLGRGSMFVVSAPQFRRILQLPDDFRGQRLMDLGAGDGATTSLLAPMFQNVHVTEVSWPMKRILSSKGFTVEPVESWHRNASYDVICALNLLDRCSTPLTLLRQMRDALLPGRGLLLIALVWPFQPYVELSPSGDHQPQERLPIAGHTFEQQVSSLIHDVLEPLDLEVVGWSRVPYLCQGDLERTFYHLHDVVVGLRLKQPSQC